MQADALDRLTVHGIRTCVGRTSLTVAHAPLDRAIGRRPLPALIALVLALVTVAGVALPVGAQNIPRDEYLRYVPLDGMGIARQTLGNEELGLWGDTGDPGYTDVDPQDGIDDRRGRVFHELGVRFAPIMVLNSTNFPVDHRWYFESGSAFPIVTDRWDVSGASPVLADVDSLDWSGLDAPCSSPGGPEADCRLQELLRRHRPIDPDRPPGPEYASQPRYFEVLFVDFPGQDVEKWSAAFERTISGDRAAAEARLPLHYVHPFTVRTDGGRYELVLQYWFFYPYNDGGNNHEGDWEHVNVVIGPLSRVGDALTRDEVTAIVEGTWPETDEIVIHRLEYYFHHKVLLLDFARPNVYLERGEWEAARAAWEPDRAGENRLLDHIRWVAFEDEAETRINTHPVVYVGADNKGTDQILVKPGASNRDSHGSYPLAGLFKDIGPAGATEQINSTFDHREWFASGGPRAGLDARRGSAISYARPERVRVLPDWERVLPLIESDFDARRDWSWLVLPLRWGYPASVSPFAGIVEHAETGNLAVPGPAYNAGWNRLGTAPGFVIYEPHMIKSVFPLGWQDNFINDLGFLNLTFPTWIAIPPLDFVWRIVSAPFRIWVKKEGPVLYPGDALPNRFVGLSAGLGAQTIPDNFTDLFAEGDQVDEWIEGLIEHIAQGDSTTMVTSADERITGTQVASAQLVFFMGRRFSTENTINWTDATITRTGAFTNIEPYVLRHELNLWDYMGTFRYTVRPGRLAPYAKLGYGISWYRLENSTINGEPMVASESPRKVKLNGNLGAGVEWNIRRSNARQFLNGLDFAVRGEWNMLIHSLGLDETQVPVRTLVTFGFDATNLPRNSTVVRHQFVVRGSVTW